MAQIFPKWSNEVPKVAPILILLKLCGIVFIIWFWFSPKHTDVGYKPHQPIPYSHKLHAGDLGMDCRYCHNNVERSAYAGVPPTQTCLNCHSQVKKNSRKLSWLRQALNEDGTTINAEAASTPWKRIHKIADYAYFDHSAHVTRGVGCVSCHGRVDQMLEVKQTQPLSMGWCLECHRNVKDFEDRGFDPATVIRPLDKVSVTDMTWGPDHPEFGAWSGAAVNEYASKLNPPIVQCSGCHR